MPIPPVDHWSCGSFAEFRLHCVPEIKPPNHSEDVTYQGNYPYQPGFIHIYLGGRDATGHLPSTHVFFALMSFAGNLIKLFGGRSTSYSSTTEPFVYRISGNRESGTVTLYYGWDERNKPFIDGAVIPMSISGSDPRLRGVAWLGRATFL